MLRVELSRVFISNAMMISLSECFIIKVQVNLSILIPRKALLYLGVVGLQIVVKFLGDALNVRNLPGITTRSLAPGKEKLVLNNDVDFLKSE